MKQAVVKAPGEIIIRDVPRPEIKPDQVLLAVKRIGVCGSDIHVYHGEHPYTPYPVVQGHEVSGVIVELGEEVNNLQIGDQATFTPQIVCGECYPCRHGRYHICDNLKVMGFQANGAAQTYFPVDYQKIVKVPASFSLDEAAMIEPLAVAVHALSRYGDVSGQGVLVLGAGTIGNLVAQVAGAMGAKRVMITDISAFKIEKARECGIANVCNVRKEDLETKIHEVFGDDKIDVIFECVGVQETIFQAVQFARKGSSIIIVGVFGEVPRVDLGLVQDRELVLKGTLMYQREDYERAVELVGRGAVNLAPMITHRYPFNTYPSVYDEIARLEGEVLKVMIAID